MLNHPWDITPQQSIALQKELASQVLVLPMEKEVDTVAGVDCAFVGRAGPILGRVAPPVDAWVIAAAVLCDARTMEIIAHSETTMACTFPYVPGLLSFREAPAVIDAIGKLPARADLLMIDGQGLAHPRGLGIASHVGLWLDMPTIGVAKSRLCGDHRQPGLRRGSHVRLMLDGRQIGSVVRTRDGVKPLYVSVGHRVTLSEAIRWTVRCAIRARLPEPTRQAHQIVTRMKKSFVPPKAKD